ncbi:MAG: EamA family transporter [Hyphomicrobiaceae bacterium]|nr:EamA family transporter [Hyphomicrobiaceae bacterium]
MSGSAGGWLEAGLYVLCIGILNIAYAYANEHGVNTFAFVLEAMLVAAVALIVLSRRPTRLREIVRLPMTWLFGATTIGMEIFYYLAISYADPAEASIFVRFSIPLSMAIGWLALGRRPDGLRLLGAGIVLAGIAWLLAIQSGRALGPILATVGASSLMFALRSFSAELHPWNRAALGVREKLSVTGQVVLVAALAGFAVLVAGMVLVRYGLLAPVPGLPVFTDLTRPLTVLLAVLFGGLVLTAMNLLMFSAVLKISTESFVAASAFVPLMTLILQEAAHAGSLIAAAPSGRQLLLVMLVVIAGNIIIVAAGMRRHGRPRR